MIKGWPVTTLRARNSRRRGEFVGARGKGRFLKCDISPATVPLGRRTIAFDPETGSLESVREAENPH